MKQLLLFITFIILLSSPRAIEAARHRSSSSSSSSPSSAFLFDKLAQEAIRGLTTPTLSSSSPTNPQWNLCKANYHCDVFIDIHSSNDLNTCLNSCGLSYDTVVVQTTPEEVYAAAAARNIRISSGGSGGGQNKEMMGNRMKYTCYCCESSSNHIPYGSHDLYSKKSCELVNDSGRKRGLLRGR